MRYWSDKISRIVAMAYKHAFYKKIRKGIKRKVLTCQEENGTMMRYSAAQFIRLAQRGVLDIAS